MDVKLSDLTERVAFCDPAHKKKQEQKLRRVRARMAVVVVASDLMSRVFVLHAWADRVSTDALIDKIFEINELYHPRQFGIEADGLQGLFGDAVDREARYRGARLPFVPVTHSTRVDKDFRIRASLQPVYGSGRLFLQPHQHDLYDEIVGFPRVPTKDLVDALASAISMLPQRPASTRRQEEAEALAEYLRATDAPPWYIEQRMAAYDKRPQWRFLR